jgi:hypothetical protein
MIHYIAEAHGLWYEGSGSWLRRIQGNPMILPLSAGERTPGPELLFYEDYFNSATRIRRGRVFEKDSRHDWAADCVARFPNRDLNNPGNAFNVNRAYKTAEVQINPGTEISLGDQSNRSKWIVVISERFSLDGYSLTLKSKTLFGVLPELKLDAIPESNRREVVDSINAVVDAATIQSPQSVIDACRNAACYVVSAEYPASNPNGEKDLGDLVKHLIREKLFVIAHASDIINKLHSRAKANAVAKLGTRPVSHQDAELAIGALAFLLQDFRWAANE